MSCILIVIAGPIFTFGMTFTVRKWVVHVTFTLSLMLKRGYLASTITNWTIHCFVMGESDAAFTIGK